MRKKSNFPSSLRRKAKNPTAQPLGGILPPKKKVTQVILGKMKPDDFARLEDLRTSPYMFYHGEVKEETEEDVAARKKREQLLKEKAVQKKKEMEEKKAEDEAENPDPEAKEAGEASPEGEEGEKKPGEGGHEKKAEGLSSMLVEDSPSIFNAPVEEIDTLEEYDDNFSHGSVLRTLKELKSRREKIMNRKYNHIFEENYPVNLRSLRKMLINLVKNDEGTIPMIRKEHLVSLLKDQLEVENDQLVQVFVQELDKKNDGTFSFQYVDGLFQKYTNYEKSRGTIQACLAVFDSVSDGDVIALKNIRQLRALKPHQLREKSDGGTFPMVKTLLDMFAHSETLTTTCTLEEFTPLFLNDEHYPMGFIEEILRQIVVGEFGHKRSDFL